jgi:hypothetical protein
MVYAKTVTLYAAAFTIRLPIINEAKACLKSG